MKIKPKLTGWLIFSLVVMMWLGVAAPIVLANGGLPDRDRPSENHDGRGEPAGAAIELFAPDYPGAWSVVQWQDINGNWQDVDGWRGWLDETGSRRWWVAAKDFGTGPFRWVVGQSAAPTATSEPFHLPAVGAETLRVTLTGK